MTAPHSDPNLVDADSSYALAGYLLDETPAGFRIPVFRSKNGVLYTCEIAPSGRVQQMYEISARSSEPFLDLTKSINLSYWSEIHLGDKCPLIYIDRSETIIQTLEDARAWILLSALRDDFSPYQRVAFGSMVSLPKALVSRNYVHARPSFADENWLIRQEQNFESMQQRLLGKNLFDVRNALARLDEPLFCLLVDEYQPLLREIDIAPYRAKRRLGRIPLSIDFALCEALSGYLHAIQICADHSSGSISEALRTLFVSLTYLDFAHGKASDAYRKDLIANAMAPVLSLYITLALRRFLNSDNKIAGDFCLVQRLQRVIDVVGKNAVFLDADCRLHLLDELFYNSERTSPTPVGAGFFVKMAEKGATSFVAKDSRDQVYKIPSGLAGYRVKRGLRDNQIVRVERLRTKDHVTTKGHTYVNNTLDTYYPVPTDKFHQRVFASNSLHMILCDDKTFSDLVRGTGSHKALMNRTNVARMLLIKYRHKIMTQLKEFVNSTWRELIIRELSGSGKYLILLTIKAGQEVDIAKVVGFYRALEVLCEIHDQMAGVSSLVRFVIRTDNVDEIIQKENAFRSHVSAVMRNENSEEERSYQNKANASVPLVFSSEIAESEKAEFNLGDGPEAGTLFEVDSGWRFYDSEDLATVFGRAA